MEWQGSDYLPTLDKKKTVIDTLKKKWISDTGQWAVQDNDSLKEGKQTRWGMWVHQIPTWKIFPGQSMGGGEPKQNQVVLLSWGDRIQGLESRVARICEQFTERRETHQRWAEGTLESLAEYYSEHAWQKTTQS